MNTLQAAQHQAATLSNVVEIVPKFDGAKLEMIRNYLAEFSHEMSAAELIGAYRKLIDYGSTNEAEESALLDLLNPFQVQ